jgi:ATP-dependent Lon protease
VLTANSVEGIPHPLLNRMAVYEVPTPTPEQAAGIAQRMYKGLAEEAEFRRLRFAAGDVVLDRMAEDIRVKATPGKGRIGF